MGKELISFLSRPRLCQHICIGNVRVHSLLRLELTQEDTDGTSGAEAQYQLGTRLHRL